MGTGRSDAGRVLARAALDGAFNGRGWQGATLLGSVRGLSARDALWRASPVRRCVWEHVLHAGYWKYAMVRVFDPSAAPDGYPRAPSDWPRVPSKPDEKAWRADRALLKAMHARLVEAVAGFDMARLGEVAPGRKLAYAEYLAGAAAHDAYHCGQIQLLKRLMRE